MTATMLEDSGRAALLAILQTAALKAAEEIMAVYASDFAHVTKADNSPLTEADTRAEAVILAILQSQVPDIPVIAEEACANGNVPTIGSRFFLVDPLDGSREFIARNGEFTVNIALIENGEPTMGIVLAPALGRVWWGDRTLGAFSATIADGKITGTEQIIVRCAPDTGLTLVGSRSHGGGEDGLGSGALSVAQFIPVGSSLKFCQIAQGTADLYPRFGRTMEWDTAAGDAILRAAGGRVVDLKGQPFLYGKRNQAEDSDFANGHFWAFGDETLGAQLGLKVSESN